MSAYERPGWYRIQLPENWVVDENEDPPAIHHPDGAGALQISTQAPRPLKPGQRIDPYLFLRAYLAQTGVGIENTEAHRYSKGKLHWATSEYDAESEDQGLLHWRIWFVTNHDILLFLTYACREEDRESERWAIDWIVDTLEIP